ncbi:hypothetical protein [Methylocystis parvus]
MGFKIDYKVAIIILGVAMFVGAMIPYAYQPRCQPGEADCRLERPY